MGLTRECSQFEAPHCGLGCNGWLAHRRHDLGCAGGGTGKAFRSSSASLYSWIIVIVLSETQLVKVLGGAGTPGNSAIFPTRNQVSPSFLISGFSRYSVVPLSVVTQTIAGGNRKQRNKKRSWIHFRIPFVKHLATND
jgi:hypothetical protein